MSITIGQRLGSYEVLSLLGLCFLLDIRCIIEHNLMHENND